MQKAEAGLEFHTRSARANIALKGNYSAGDSKVLDSNTAPVQIQETLPENVPATQEAPVEQAPAAEEQPAQE